MPLWHGSPQGWPQMGLISSQGWVHFVPSSWQTPIWHIFLHKWPHSSSLRHSLPQETFFWKQGIDVRIIFPQLHLFSIKTGQGGHSASEWQLWWTFWSFKWFLKDLESRFLDRNLISVKFCLLRYIPNFVLFFAKWITNKFKKYETFPSWPQAWARLHFSKHSGGIVPHWMGG